MKRKKLTGWKRMAAFAMALTLTIGDGASVWAAVVPQTVTETAAQTEDAMEAVGATEQTESEADSESVENDNGQTKESEAAEVSEVTEITEKVDETETEGTTETVNNTETTEDTENNDETESVETETETETEQETEKETEEERAAIDKPSKVINVSGERNCYTLTTQSGKLLRYVYANQFQNGVIVAGTPDERVDYKIVKRSSLWDKTVGLYKYGNDYYGQCGSTDIDGFVRLYYKAETIIKGNTEQYKDA